MSLTIIYGIQELILFSKYHNLQIHSFTDKVANSTIQIWMLVLQMDIR